MKISKKAFNAMFHVGQKVRCCLDGDTIDREDWYAGRIVHLETEDGENIVNIERDDGINGLGYDAAWYVTINSKTIKYLRLLSEGEWDDSVNDF